jgi:Icc-related predicted phosphoesterase
MADIHGSLDVYRRVPHLAVEYQAEVLVLAGDLLGGPDNDSVAIEEAQCADAREILRMLKPLTVPVLYIMRNDDLVEPEPAGSQFQSIHGRRLDLGAYNFVGYQFSPPFMGGIFEKLEEEIATDLSRLESFMDSATVLVTHSPAQGILDRGILDLPAGSPSILAVTNRRPVRAHIHGHIHECFGREGRHFNVAVAGQLRGMVIDLTTMSTRSSAEQSDVAPCFRQVETDQSLPDNGICREASVALENLAIRETHGG